MFWKEMSKWTDFIIIKQLSNKYSVSFSEQIVKKNIIKLLIK